MKRVLRSALVAVAFAPLACGAPVPDPILGPAPTSTTTASAAPVPAALPEPEVDPVSVGMTAPGVTKLCDDNLALAQRNIEAVKALAGAPPERLTFETTLGRFDDAVLAYNTAAEFPYLMGVAHPDGAVREAAKACEPKADKFITGVWLDATLAGVVKAYAARKEPLAGERARLLSDTLRDFRRNGLELPADKQQRVRQLNEEITQIGQDFQSNIAKATGKIEVKPASLKGLKPEYIASHKPNTKGMVEITTDYPDFFPFVTYSPDRKAALDLYVLFTNRGGDENVKLLEKLLVLRQEKAKLLGFATWADYATEPRMAKTSKNVRDFLGRLRDALKAPAKAELEEFVKEYKKLGGKGDKLVPPDRYWLEDRVRQSKYKFDSRELSNYLEIGSVKKGLMDITARMYGLEYKEIEAKAWHPDVTAFEVYSAKDKKRIGKFYFDLYPRPDKYKHAAMFTVRSAKTLSDGRWREPWAALVCNFPKPGAEQALMQHEDMITFFHEFGHVLHHLLTRAGLASFSGTATVRDFVEAPSQMFEEWGWSREVLDLFAKHHKTGEKIPEPLFQAMTRARGFGRALSTQRQLFLASLDQELHSRPVPMDSTKVVEEVQNSTDSFGFVPGTHFQSSFGHLIGYDAAYYGYQWALSLSRDVLTRFKKDGLLNPTAAAAWRDEVLSRGGGEDERAMISKFLGRAPSDEAYFAYIAGKD
ncbi:MAG: M3 family metallopeptidase [Polyangiaceae bacterium]